MFNSELKEKVKMIEGELERAMDRGTKATEDIFARLCTLEMKHSLLVEFLELDFVENDRFDKRYEKFPKKKKK